MKIKIAHTAGFCMGVRRAVDIAVDTASAHGKKVFTIGPLIHNNQTIELLRDRGVETLGETDPAPGSATILIRAHGVPPDLQCRYEQAGHVIIDGTCPKVKTVHKVIQKYRSMGYDIVIAGDQGHAEVIGLMGYAGDAGHLIQTADDVEKLPAFHRVCLVSQTTFDRNEFAAIAERMRQRFGTTAELVIKRTICSATDKRQEETVALAKTVDAMIVVGGKNSANTLRLAKISRESNTPTQHVETPEEIDWPAIARCKTVGITAGASTPNWMIKRVAEHIQYLAETRRRTFKSFVWRLLNAGVNINMFIAAGAVALYYFSCVAQGFPFTWQGAGITFLYFLSMYLWNSLVNIDQMRHLGLNRYQFYRAHRPAVWTLAIVCIVLLLWISLRTSAALFYLMLFLTAAGSVYHFTIVPPVLRKLIKYKTLKDIPTSRDLFVALAWSVLITFMPHTIRKTAHYGPLEVFVFFWVFLLAFLRSLMFDLRDIEGDRIMGRETLVILVGEKTARRVIEAALGLSLAALLAFTVCIVAPLYCWSSVRTLTLFLQFPALVYSLAFMKYSNRIPQNRSALFSILADIQFFLSGFGAAIAAALACQPGN